MTPRPTSIRHLLIVLAAVALALPASSVAAEPSAAPAGPQTETTTPAPAPEAPAPAVAPQAPQTETAPAGSEAAAAPKVAQQLPQGATSGGSRVSHANRSKNEAEPGGGTKNGGTGEGEGEGTGSAPRAKQPAPLPSGLTPSLSSALQSSLTGVPEFFIESFQIPPFLLPIFQAAGTAYGIPWQVLAAINEVETDYGRDLSVSSAGAEGWMQFLPAEWAQYGVDANGDGVRDPYNPADAIFAAARYLRAAGGETNIRAAIYSYNHSQAYVASVMLRAQLLGGTPSELLGAITGLTEARFPVHAAAHYSDGFATAPASGSTPGAPVVGTTIYAATGSPVIAVQDGEIVQIGESPALGHFVVLRDAFGNRYTYARLGDIASLYPVLEPHLNSTVSSRISHSSSSREPAPGGPATAGAQPRSPVSEGATVSGLALGAAATLESVPQVGTTTAAPAPAPAPASQPAAQVRSFRSGSDEVFLHPLHAGVEVIAGTVLGHVGAATEGAGAETAPHILFQIRPAGIGAPLIDPKPILDGWVALENSSIFRAKGENPFLATSPTVGQVLLESKQQLEPQVLHDTGIRLAACGRQDVQSGRVDKRALALLEYMSVSGLKPTVAGLRCAGATPAAIAAYAPARAASENIDITAINGIPVAGHQGPGSITDIAVRKLLMLQGAARPLRIVSRLSYRGAASAVASAAATDAIEVDYAPPAGTARTASAASTLSPSEWIKLVARLGEIPDPTVAAAPSAAAIPDEPHAAGNGAEGGAGGNH